MLSPTTKKKKKGFLSSFLITLVLSCLHIWPTAVVGAVPGRPNHFLVISGCFHRHICHHMGFITSARKKTDLSKKYVQMKDSGEADRFVQKSFYCFIKTYLEGWQNLCYCASQPVGLLPGYLLIPKGDGSFCISVASPVQRMPCITVASLSNSGWSGPLKQHMCIFRRVGSGRGWLDCKTVALFCLVIQSPCTCVPRRDQGFTKGQAIPIKLCSLFNFSVF